MAGAITAATVVGGVGTPSTVVGRFGVTVGVAAGIVVATGAGVVTTGAGAVGGGVKSETVHLIGVPGTSTQVPVPPVPPADTGDAASKATAINAAATRIIFLMFFPCLFVWWEETARPVPVGWFVITNRLMPECPLYL